MGLPLLFLKQLFSNIHAKILDYVPKTEFNVKWPSRSFKVVFSVSEKATREGLNNTMPT